MKKYVLFDCDGVLVNSEEIAAEAETKFLEQLGLFYTEEEKNEFFSGVTLEAHIDRVKSDYQKKTGQEVPEETLTELLNSYAGLMATDLQAIHGVKPMLKELRRAGIPYAVASNSGKAALDQKLKKTGLYKLFAPHIYSREDVANPKPAPDLFAHAGKLLAKSRGQKDFKAADYIVVEDSVTGVKAGTSAGMYVIGYAGGAHRSKMHKDFLRAAGASHVCRSTKEVKRHILKVFDQKYPHL